jgi:hypothetical protein
VALESASGYLYYRKMRDKDKALEQFNKLLKYYPDSDKAAGVQGHRAADRESRKAE